MVFPKSASGVLKYKMLILGLLPAIVFILSLMLGRYSVSPRELFTILFSKAFLLEHNWTTTVDTVIFQVRLPRITAAMLVGASLAASGSAYQGMFKNPMVSPDILGASAGAGFGAAMGILFSFGVVGIQLSSFFFGLLAVLITYLISVRIGRNNDAMLVLVLAGIVVGTLFSSFISLIKYVADPYSKLPAITFWLMGSLAAVNPRDVMVIILPTVLGGVPLLLLRWRLNILSFGDEEAQALGINTRRLRLTVILCSTLLTASAVSVSGLIGWIGLVVPHLARMIVGPNYKSLMPASILLGATYLLIVDDLARSIYAMEIPLGILTSLIGAPFFIYLLINARRGWE